MAAFHGKLGNIFWDQTGVDTNIDNGQNWTLNATADIAESTGFQATWKSYKGGFLDWTATVETTLDTAGLDVPLATGSQEALGEDTPAELELYLRADTVNNVWQGFYGKAICVGVDPVLDANDIAKVTYSFQGTGELFEYDSASARKTLP